MAAVLSHALGAQRVTILEYSRLEGGAIQSTLALDADVDGGLHAGRHQWVLRCDSASTIGESRSRHEEHALLTAAWQAGVRVPRPIAIGTFDDGREFSVVERLDGMALGPRVVRDTALGGDRDKLVRELGRQLGRIHAIELSAGEASSLGLSFDERPLHTLIQEQLDSLCSALDALGAERPVLERGIRLMRRRSDRWSGRALAPALVHRDFRTGNLLLGTDGLEAVLDWEFAGCGDPLSDIGWFCARCWRFSRPDLEAGGLGDRQALYEGYAEVSSIELDHERIAFWEVFAHLRWAVIALQQGARHATEPSLALALTGRICESLERDALAQLLGRPAHLKTNDLPRDLGAQSPTHAGVSSGHVAGSALAEILGQTLNDEIANAGSGSSLTLRMSRNAAAILGREAQALRLREDQVNRLMTTTDTDSVAHLCGYLREEARTPPELDDQLMQLANINAWVYQGVR